MFKFWELKLVSAGSRIIIAAISLVCAAGFFLTALDFSAVPANAHAFYGLASFSLVVAIASLFPKSHPITLRMIGTLIFCGYMVYAGNSLHSSHLLQALVASVSCGLPAGYLAITGKYPSWGQLNLFWR